MKQIILANTPEENAFKSIADFQNCMRHHGEVGFTYLGKEYGISHPQEGKTIIMNTTLKKVSNGLIVLMNCSNIGWKAKNCVRSLPLLRFLTVPFKLKIAHPHRRSSQRYGHSPGQPPACRHR